MLTVAARDLRNHTADVLRTVSDGTPVTVTVNGTAVAEIRAVRNARPQFLSKADVVRLVASHQADAGLARDLERLAGTTTDELDAV